MNKLLHAFSNPDPWKLLRPRGTEGVGFIHRTKLRLQEANLRDTSHAGSNRKFSVTSFTLRSSDPCFSSRLCGAEPEELRLLANRGTDTSDYLRRCWVCWTSRPNLNHSRDGRSVSGFTENTPSVSSQSLKHFAAFPFLVF